jgi:threonine/homoserine/homoserine lactone efflux protein
MAMLGIENLGAFILTAIIVVITPGVDTIMVLNAKHI